MILNRRFLAVIFFAMVFVSMPQVVFFIVTKDAIAAAGTAISEVTKMGLGLTMAFSLLFSFIAWILCGLFFLNSGLEARLVRMVVLMGGPGSHCIIEKKNYDWTMRVTPKKKGETFRYNETEDENKYELRVH